MNVRVVLPFCALAFTIAFPELAWCVESPPYEPVIMCLPETIGVYETEQVDMLGPLLGVNVQLADGLKTPVLLVVKLTVPVGLVGLAEVSTTRAVQVVADPTITEPGTQAIAVEVVRCETDVKVNVATAE